MRLPSRAFDELATELRGFVRQDSTSIPGLSVTELTANEGAQLWLAAHSHALFPTTTTTTPTPSLDRSPTP